MMIDQTNTGHSIQGMSQPRQVDFNEQAEKKSNQSQEEFIGFLESAIKNVNENQLHAQDLTTRLEKGRGDISLAEVMIASQKANISFQAMVQVRNKLLSAYQDVMSMPI